MRYLIKALATFVMVMSGATSVFADNMVLSNGKIWTGNKTEPWATTVVVEGNRIVAVGNADLLSTYANYKVVDVDGKLVLPGFIDNHTHFMEGAASLVAIQTIKARTPQEFTEIIKNYAEITPKGEWITGGLWDHEIWGGELPHKKWVDAYTQDNPLLILRTAGHMAFANSKALAFAGITKDTIDPEGGVIVRDIDGEPTGVLKDTAMYLVSKAQPAPSDNKIDVIFDAGINEALRVGVTQVHSIDMGVWDNLPIFKRAKQEGRLKIRAYYISHISKRHELAEMIATEGRGDNWLRFGGVKAMSDGALGAGTAWLYEPYNDNPNTSGFPLKPMDELKQELLEAHNYGFQLAVHAIGDKANDEVLNIFEELGEKGRRPRIEHAQHLSVSAIGRFEKQGVIAAFHPYHVFDDARFAEKRIGAERLNGTYAFNSVLETGAIASFGSDWPVAPLDPLLGIYVATTRHSADGKYPRGWMPQEKVTVEQAVRAYTINNAWAGNQENDLGTIEVGKLADMVVISDNIFEIAPYDIKDANILMTIIDGKIMYAVE